MADPGPDVKPAVGPGTAAFEVRGVRNGSLVTIRWDGGRLAGDPPTVDLLEVEADLAVVARRDPFVQRGDSDRWGNPGTGADDASNPLARPETALALIRRTVDRITQVTPREPAAAGERPPVRG